MRAKVNSYNISDPQHPGTIIFHAIAKDEEQVKMLARDNGINLTNLKITMERMNVRDELGNPYAPSIVDAIIH